MKKLAYLGCKYSMSTSHQRREDSFEHDLEIEAFSPAFADAGLQLHEVNWTELDPHSPEFDLLFVRTTWDYVEKPDVFLDFLKVASTNCQIENDPSLIEWNISKHYLAEMLSRGLPVVPSKFIADEGVTIDQLRHHLGANKLVLKPVFGGGGYGQRLVNPEDDGDEPVSVELFAQPFMPEIQEGGEASLIFVGDAYSHAIRKLPAPGEYLVQSYHGGSILSYEASNREIDIARQFILELPRLPLACRIDFLLTPTGPLLMELEAIEPHLFPQQNSRLGKMLAMEITRRLKGAF